MSDRKRIFLLISIMALSSLLVAGITIASLYNAAISEEQERLVETVQSQARLIEAVARFDAIHIKTNIPGGARAATLTQIITAHKNYEQSGRTTEFTLAQKKGETINFLLRHRHGGLEQSSSIDFDSRWSPGALRVVSFPRSARCLESSTRCRPSESSQGRGSCSVDNGCARSG